MQVGWSSFAFTSSSIASYTHAGSLPYNDHAADPTQGTDQIVGIGDTGLDLQSCFFADSTQPNVPGGSGSGWGTDGISNPMFNSTTHRKIALYRALVDETDAEGHGSHCGGSIAGSYQNGVLPHCHIIALLPAHALTQALLPCVMFTAQSRVTRCKPCANGCDIGTRCVNPNMPLCAAPRLWWSGAAPLAKLAFTDLGSGTTGSLDGLSYLNLTKDYYPWPYVRSASNIPTDTANAAYCKMPHVRASSPNYWYSIRVTPSQAKTWAAAHHHHHDELHCLASQRGIVPLTLMPATVTLTSATEAICAVSACTIPRCSHRMPVRTCVSYGNPARTQTLTVILTLILVLRRGARVHSDSWTSSNGAAYNVHSQEADLFAWLFQDFLPVFAAGNFGTQLYDGTISAPATAKNCLAVGESLLADTMH